MDTLQLNYILQHTIAEKISYLHVLACDKLNQVPKTDFAVIVNTDISTMSGTHWLAMYKSKSMKNVEWFDSFGMPLKHYHEFIGNFLKSLNCKISSNKKQLESDDADTCGHFCVYFLINRCLGVSFTKIINQFSCNTRLNDSFVYSYVNNLHIFKPKNCRELCSSCRKFKLYFTVISLIQCNRKKIRLLQ